MMKFNVMTSNIRFANPHDGNHHWPYRKELWASIVKDSNIDILATQEGREPQLREALALLPNYTLVDTHRPWIEERMYPCLFIKNNTFKLHRSGDIWLSETPYILASQSFGSVFPRLSTFAELECVISHQKFFVINCHLDHERSATRVQQVQVLLNELERNNQDQLPVILLGDFNEGPDGEVRHVINTSPLGLEDSWKQSEEGSFHGFTGQHENHSRIDWILHSHELTSNQTTLIKTSKNSIYPSDHYPVRTTIMI